MAQNRVIWTAAALADVDAIASFIARDSERYADAVIEELLDAAGSLAALPDRGRIVPETADESIRERFVRSWRLMYRVQPDVVTILAVVHQRQHVLPDAERFRRS